MDKVYIQGLTLYSLIGVYDFERHKKQRVIADVTLYSDLSKAASTDNVLDTLDYGKVAERLDDIAANASYQLLEALAHKMISTVFDEFAVDKLELSLSKPDILDNATNVGVTFVRERAASSKKAQATN
ncbi:dihydroneopterin aldolase [Ningiella sp. W23]|uniref:dihydroneopterin aldolase n=1 Tax=Ningiella sp. W23 TaxID=3023715 RepID=UPI003757FC7A